MRCVSCDRLVTSIGWIPASPSIRKMVSSYQDEITSLVLEPERCGQHYYYDISINKMSKILIQQLQLQHTWAHLLKGHILNSTTDDSATFSLFQTLNNHKQTIPRLSLRIHTVSHCSSAAPCFFSFGGNLSSPCSSSTADILVIFAHAQQCHTQFQLFKEMELPMCLTSLFSSCC